MTAYILGAGASAHAGYPLASSLLRALSDWLDCASEAEHWVGPCRNRILQVHETFGSLEDFEGILGKLEAYGYRRVRPAGPVTYRQDPKDIFHDCTEQLRGARPGKAVFWEPFLVATVECGSRAPPRGARGLHPRIQHAPFRP